MSGKPDEASSVESCSREGRATRRDFLKGATSVVAANLLTPSAPAAEPPGALPTVPLGSHRVTRLISGANPIYGYSHFNQLYSQHMLEWFTDERVVEYLKACEKAGMDTWQSNYHPRVPQQIPKIRAAGCKIQWICLAAPWDATQAKDWTPDAILDGMLKCADLGAKLKPIAIVHHGWATDRLWRAGNLGPIKTFINKVHDLGFAAGISTHNPAILDALEEKDWAHDFYMASFHFVSRSAEEYQRDFGMAPVGEVYIAGDPPRMCEAVRRVAKPCLVYKVFAAGRQCGSSEERQKALEFAYKNIKPTDAAIVGMYPRYSDQIGENVGMVRAILS